jgi:signal transduction histidine kinase
MGYRFHRLVCFFLLLSVVAFAQLDERKSVGARRQAADTVRVNVLVQQIFKLRESDPSRAIKLSLEAISLSQQLGYQKGIGRATTSLGWIYFRRGDYVKALEYTIESLKISEQIGDAVGTAHSLNNMAAIYNEEKQYDQSLKHLKRALRIARHQGDPKAIARSLNNMGLLYLMAFHKLDSCEAYAMEALMVSEKHGDEYSGAHSNRILGDLHFELGESKEALKYYFRTLELSDGVSNSLKAETWNQIAETYIRQNKLAEAIPILTKNLEVTKKYSYRDELARSYRLLSELYQQLGKLSYSLDYLQRYTALHDSIYNEHNGMQLATLQSQFDLDLKQAQIELLTKDTQLNKKEISQQRIQLYATIGGLICILLITFLLFYVNRKVSQSNVLLGQQKDALAQKNREVEFKSRELGLQAEQLAQLNATKDKLFSIIGHDFRGPLNRLKGMLELVENQNLSQQQFTSIATALKSNLDSVSTTLENLLHWSLAQLQGIQTNPVKINLQAMVEEHVALYKELAKAKNVRLENEISDLLALADEDHTRVVLRNLINNAIKFSLPDGVVKISCRDEGSFVKIQVADTGVGIAPSQLRSLFLKEKVPSTKGTHHERGAGIGLMLCQEFVENNGGRLSVASELGKGSVFSFTLKAA